MNILTLGLTLQTWLTNAWQNQTNKKKNKTVNNRLLILLTVMNSWKCRQFWLTQIPRSGISLQNDIVSRPDFEKREKHHYQKTRNTICISYNISFKF